MSNVSMIDGHIDEPKVTDEKIIKALECCVGNTPCFELDCPFQEFCKEDIDALQKHSLDLIKRQQTENERLKKSLDNMTDALIKTDEACRKAKTEAIKELDDKFGLCLAIYENAYIENQNWCARDTVRGLTFEFQEFVKEMVGV